MRVAFDSDTSERVVVRARRYQKTMNLIVVGACRDLVGEEQKGNDPGENGIRPETIKGGPKDLSELDGWPSPVLFISIGETTHDKVAREAK